MINGASIYQVTTAQTKKTANKKQAEESLETSIFSDLQNSVEESQAQKAEKPTTYTTVGTEKDENGNKTGVYKIRVYEDSSKSELICSDVCFIFQTEKNKKKYKFKTGQGNTVDFVKKGKNISVTVSNGNRSIALNAQKNDDGTYELDGETYNSINELAVMLNSVKLPSTIKADGIINASEQAPRTGDCSLLSVLNSLSYSEGGREILERVFDINKDENTITVNLPGFGVSYTYKTDGIINRIYNNVKYSIGDLEPYFLERAMNDAFDDLKSGKIKLSEDAPSWCKKPDKIKKGKGIVDGIEPMQMYYALTGLECNQRTLTTTQEGLQWFKDNAKNEDNSMVASILAKKGQQTGKNHEFYSTDAFGRQVRLYRSHAYAIKDVSTKTNGENVITLVEPSDSSQEIVLDESTFLTFFNVIDSTNFNNEEASYYR